MNNPELMSLLLATQEGIKPKEYDASWMDSTISIELNNKNNTRRKSVLASVEKLFSSFNDEWTLSHTCNLVDPLLMDRLWFSRKAYYHPMIEFSVFSPTKNPQTSGVVSLQGEEFVCSRDFVCSHVDEFIKENNRIVPNYFSGYYKKLMKHMIRVAGAEYQISLSKVSENPGFPSIGWKVTCNKLDFDFTTTVLLMAPTRAGLRKEVGM